MYDEEAFKNAARVEDWTALAGSAATARAKSAGLRRTRYAGIVGVTAAVTVGAAAIAGTFGTGSADGSAVSPGAGRGPAAVASSTPAPARTTSSATPRVYAKGTMGELFQQWKSCPDAEMRAERVLPEDPKDLQQRWRDACRRNMSTLSAMLPGYDVTPGVIGINTPGLHPTYTPDKFDDPSFVIPAGYTPHMGPNVFRTVGPDGTTSSLLIRAYGRDDNTRPATGEEVTLPNGLKGRLTLGTELQPGENGYELYILDHGKTFYTVSWKKPNFDFKALVMSPQFADMAARALAAPES